MWVLDYGWGKIYMFDTITIFNRQFYCNTKANRDEQTQDFRTKKL